MNIMIKYLKLLIFVLIIGCVPNFDNPVDPENPNSIPPIIENFRVLPVDGQNNMQIIFEYSYENASGVIVLRADSGADMFYSLDTVFPPITSVLDTHGTTDYTLYSYKLVAFNSNGLSALSKVISARTDSLVPVDLQAPVISVLHDGNPLIGFKTVKDSFPVLSGIVQDRSDVGYFHINGHVVSLDSIGRWSYVCTLTAFTHKLLLEAADLSPAVNVARDTIALYYDYPNKPRILNIDFDSTVLKFSWTSCSDIDFKGYAIWFSSSGSISTELSPDTIIWNRTDTNFSRSATISDEIHFGVAILDSSFNYVISGNSHGHIRTGLTYRNRMVRISAGSFRDSSTNATASLTRSYYMDTVEVSQKLFNDIGENFSVWPGPDLPVTDLSWYQTIVVLNEMSKRDGFDTAYTYSYIRGDTAHDLACDWNSDGYRLPTEDEWEYACRAGSQSRFFWGEDTVNHSEILKYAWYDVNCIDSVSAAPSIIKLGSQPVGTKFSNGYGLYDMLGNVWEFCWDWYASSTFRIDGRTDYRGVEQSSQFGKVIKGGYWFGSSGNLGSANRTFQDPSRRTFATGIRRVISISPK